MDVTVYLDTRHYRRIIRLYTLPPDILDILDLLNCKLGATKQFWLDAFLCTTRTVIDISEK